MSFLRSRGGKAQIARLTRILDRQKTALLSGRVEDLVGQTEALGTILHTLETQTERASDLDAALLDETLKKAKANLTLIQAGMDGVKAAQAQLAEIARAQTELTTYSGTGQRRDLLAQHQRLEKRL